MLLVPEKLNFRLSTTDLEVIYTESSGVRLKIEVQTFSDFKNDKYSKAELQFNNVAELKCTSLNFYEFHHGEFVIESINNDVVGYWEKKDIHSDPGVYMVSSSEVLESRGAIYDPNNRLSLKHFIVVGYDSYVEIISSNYEVRVE
ncbi:hypothetical protein QM201_07625 [Enterobacter asburiae]|nr:hypothetical protein [Enterobacter asburiae]